jgi:vacuolar-type H+-ATPase catalytic subunit A/Vma1
MVRQETKSVRTQSQREQELDDLLESLLETRERLTRVGKAIGPEALSGSAALLSDSARLLSREADRIDPSPWHQKLWRRIKRASA